MLLAGATMPILSPTRRAAGFTSAGFEEFAKSETHEENR